MMETPYSHTHATILGLRLADGDLGLDLECYTDNDDIAVNVSLVFRQIENLRITLADGSDGGGVEMVAPDGEIVSYSVEKTPASIVIQWNGCVAPLRRREQIGYAFNFKTLEETRGPDTVRAV